MKSHIAVYCILAAAAGYGLGWGHGRSLATVTVQAQVRGEALEALDEKLTQLAANRCMNITTPVLNISVYDTPNLGTQKTSKAPVKQPVRVAAIDPEGNKNP